MLQRMVTGILILGTVVAAVQSTGIDIELTSVSCFGACPPYFGHTCYPFDDCCLSSILVNGTEYGGNDGVSVVAVNATSGHVVTSFHLMDEPQKMNEIADGTIVLVVSQYACDGDLQTYVSTLEKYLHFGKATSKSWRRYGSLLAVKCKGSCPPLFSPSAEVLTVKRKGYIKQLLTLNITSKAVDKTDVVVCPTNDGCGRHRNLNATADDKTRNGAGPTSSKLPLVVGIVVGILSVAIVVCILLVIFRKKLLKRFHVASRTLSSRSTNAYEPPQVTAQENATEPYMHLYTPTTGATYEPLCKPNDYENAEQYNGNIYSCLNDNEECRVEAGTSSLLFTKGRDPSHQSPDSKFASYVIAPSLPSRPVYKNPSSVPRRQPPSSSPPRAAPDRDSYVSMHAHDYDEPASLSLARSRDLPTDGGGEGVYLGMGSNAST